MAGIRERDKPGRLVEDSSVWKILYHLCSLFAICSFRDCLSIKARIEPGPCRRPEAPIHFRRRPRGAAEPHFPPETLKTTPEHAEGTRCAGVAYSRRWQAYPFQVPAARHERAVLASGDLAAKSSQCRFLYAHGLSRLHPASFHPQGKWYVGDDRCQPAWPRRATRPSGSVAAPHPS